MANPTKGATPTPLDDIHNLIIAMTEYEMHPYFRKGRSFFQRKKTLLTTFSKIQKNTHILFPDFFN